MVFCAKWKSQKRNRVCMTYFVAGTFEDAVRAALDKYGDDLMTLEYSVNDGKNHLKPVESNSTEKN